MLIKFSGSWISYLDVLVFFSFGISICTYIVSEHRGTSFNHSIAFLYDKYQFSSELRVCLYVALCKLTFCNRCVLDCCISLQFSFRKCVSSANPNREYKETTISNNSCLSNERMNVDKCSNYLVQQVHLFTPHNLNRIFKGFSPFFDTKLAPQRHKNNVFDLPSQFTVIQWNQPLNASQCDPLKCSLYIESHRNEDKKNQRIFTTNTIFLFGIVVLETPWGQCTQKETPS